jgi:hypothetical protein
MKFQHIIDDGEVSKDILDTILNKFGDISDLSVLSSNGSSFVFISSEKINVYQYFNFKNIVLNILNIFEIIKKNNIVKFNLDLEFFKININDHICQFISHEPENIIVWKKHLCLNSFDNNYKKHFILKNILKLTWDIGKCLYSLHENNIYHGDPTIDNIGILNNNFILFDFDASKNFNNNDKYYLSKNDIYKFINSIKFNTSNDKNINFYNDTTSYQYLLNIIEDGNLSYTNRINELNSLKIIL